MGVSTLLQVHSFSLVVHRVVVLVWHPASSWGRALSIGGPVVVPWWIHYGAHASASSSASTPWNVLKDIIVVEGVSAHAHMATSPASGNGPFVELVSPPAPPGHSTVILVVDDVPELLAPVPVPLIPLFPPLIIIHFSFVPSIPIFFSTLPTIILVVDLVVCFFFSWLASLFLWHHVGLTLSGVLGLRGLVAYVFLVERVFGECGLHFGDTTFVFDLWHIFNLGLFHRLYHVGGDVVDLVKVPYSAFDQLNKNQSLYDGVARGADLEAAVVSFVENAECVSKVVFNLSLGLHPNFVLGCLGPVLVDVLGPFYRLFDFFGLGLDDLGLFDLFLGDSVTHLAVVEPHNLI